MARQTELDLEQKGQGLSEDTRVLPLEVACTFGSDCQLAGVYTPAQGPAPGAAHTSDHTAEDNRPCAIYLTAGLLHHVGPSRLHVELSRSLSVRNVAGLRFDLSGVGDSETSSLGGYFMERSAQEIIQAMDFLQTEFGHRKFVLIGLCSGADDALACAQRDARVSGIVLLNGYCYQAGWFKLARFWRFYLPRLLMVRKLKNGLLRVLKKCQRSHSQSKRLNTDQKSVEPSGEVDDEVGDQLALQQLDDDYRYIPLREETQRQLLSLREAETDMMFIYTGSEHEEFSYAGQFNAMFPALADGRCVTAHYIEEADHTLILKQDRQKVIDLTTQWFLQCRFSRRTI